MKSGLQLVNYIRTSAHPQLSAMIPMAAMLSDQSMQHNINQYAKQKSHLHVSDAPRGAAEHSRKLPQVRHVVGASGGDV